MQLSKNVTMLAMGCQESDACVIDAPLKSDASLAYS